MVTCTFSIPSPSRDASRIVLRSSVCTLIMEARGRAMNPSSPRRISAAGTRRPPARGSRAVVLPVYAERRGPALIRRGGEGSEIEGPLTAKLLDTPCKVIYPVSHSKQTIGATIKCHTFRTPVHRCEAAGERNLGPKIKREANAKGIHLPGWVGFVADTQLGILVFPRLGHRANRPLAGATCNSSLPRRKNWCQPYFWLVARAC